MKGHTDVHALIKFFLSVFCGYIFEVLNSFC